MKQVPVAGLLLASMSTAWENRGIYLKALALPLIVLAALTFVGALVPEDWEDVPGWYVPLLFAAGFAGIFFAIACHRLVLLGPPERPFAFSLGRRELKFILVSILLGLIFTIIMGITMLVLVFVLIPLLGPAVEVFSGDTPSEAAMAAWGIFLAGFFSILPAYYVLARCSMVLPAIAVGDEGFEIQDSWHMTKDNQWQVFVIVAVYPFIMSIIGEVFLLAGSNPFTNALSSIAYCIGLALGIFALSFVYRFLREDYELTVT